MELRHFLFAAAVVLLVTGMATGGIAVADAAVTTGPIARTRLLREAYTTSHSCSIGNIYTVARNGSSVCAECSVPRLQQQRDAATTVIACAQDGFGRVECRASDKQEFVWPQCEVGHVCDDDGSCAPAAAAAAMSNNKGRRGCPVEMTTRASVVRVLQENKQKSLLEPLGYPRGRASTIMALRCINGIPTPPLAYYHQHAPLTSEPQALLLLLCGIVPALFGGVWFLLFRRGQGGAGGRGAAAAPNPR